MTFKNNISCFYLDKDNEDNLLLKTKTEYALVYEIDDELTFGDKTYYIKSYSKYLKDDYHYRDYIIEEKQ